MRGRDRWIAYLVALIWGLNFLAVRIGLEHFPPFFLAAVRYLVVAVPVVLLVPRPKAPLRWLFGYGLGFGVMQFGLLFLAIEVGMPTGLSSVVLQAGPPFAVILGVLLLHERVSGWAWSGVGLAVAGLVLIAIDRAQVAGLVPMLLTVGAALGWALGTLSSRLAQPDSALRFALWMSVVPPVPLLVLSAVVEGPSAGWDSMVAAVSSEGLPGLVALSYIVLIGTVAGSALWSSLLKRHPASAVAPYSMLVPVVGILAAWVALDEVPTLISVVGAALVISGVLLGTARRRTPAPPAAAEDATTPDPMRSPSS